MELYEVLLKRRSVRKFTAQEVSDDIIDELMHAAMSGPSACNKKPWEFYVVKSNEAVERLRGTTEFSKIIAPMAIVVCGNGERMMPAVKEFVKKTDIEKGIFVEVIPGMLYD